MLPPLVVLSIEGVPGALSLLTERPLHSQSGWEEKQSIGQLPPMCALAGDQTCTLGMCPDWKPNPKPFGSGTIFQPTEPPGQSSASCEAALETQGGIQ